MGYAKPVLDTKLQRGHYVLWYFFNIDLCSATSMESSRRDLANDMAEHNPILKSNIKTYCPRFSSALKTGTIIDRKNVPTPCNHLDIGVLRLPTLARNQLGNHNAPMSRWLQGGWGRFFCQ